MSNATFAVFVYPDVEPIDIGATFGVLSMARRVDPTISVFTVGRRKGLVELANGLEIVAQHEFEECPAADVLLVLGGAGWPEQCDDPRTQIFIRSFAQRGTVASVCTGALIVAATGLLDGKRATTRRRAPMGAEAPLDTLGRRFPSVHTTEARFVDHGAIVTGGGVMLAVDTTLHLIARTCGRSVADQTACLIEYDVAWRANIEAFQPAA